MLVIHTHTHAYTYIHTYTYIHVHALHMDFRGGGFVVKKNRLKIMGGKKKARHVDFRGGGFLEEQDLSAPHPQALSRETRHTFPKVT